VKWGSGYNKGEEEAVIEIIDKGPSIPVTELERIFDPFHRLTNLWRGQ
jgi:signal transduction histidine kinase